MAVKTNTLSTPKEKRPSRSRKGVSVVTVSGDSALKHTPLKKLKKVSAARRAMEPERTNAPAVLISVDINAGPAKVSRYAGLFFMFVGVLFATHSLSGMYVELVELGTSDQHVFAPKAQLAQVITATAQIATTTITTAALPTQTQIAPLPPEPLPSATTHATNSNATTTVIQPKTSPVPVPQTFDKTLMEPAVEVVVRGGVPHQENEEVAIRVQNAHTVEMILVPRETLTERYLGKAKHVSNDYWQFVFDTRNAPNGEYALFARVTNSYGSYQSRPLPLRIKNVVPALPQNSSTTTTPETAAIQAEIANVAIEFKASEPRTDLGTAVVPMIAKTPYRPVPPESEQNAPVTGSSTNGTTTAPVEAVAPPLPEPLEERAVQFVDSIDSDLGVVLELYGVAIRGNDSGAIKQMEQRLIDFELEIAKRVESELIGEGMVATTDDAAIIRERIIGLVREERTRRHKEERMILDRVGDKIQRDSDRDGISDYDEANLYETDPFVADTDSDGFLDGAEVLSGYDPANDVREAMVAFEDPRAKGVERADILEVSRLDVIQEEGASTTEAIERGILLSGVALPNSFVTLYVYSTPVVVTVKTNDDGSWSYAFDKELEDGQHEVFVGVTDNAGKLVAKSKPFAFIKTANAYAIGRVQNEPMPIAAPEPRLMSENVIILTTSLVVILVGLVLILIGAYLARRTHPALTIAPGAAGTA